jgi:hypothetical protein
MAVRLNVTLCVVSPALVHVRPLAVMDGSADSNPWVDGVTQMFVSWIHPAGTGMQQSQCREFGICSTACWLWRFAKSLTRLQAADANALVEIESRAPSLLESLLKAAPEVPVLPEHARSARPQAFGQHVGGCLGCLVERSGKWGRFSAIPALISVRAGHGPRCSTSVEER